MSLQFHFLPLEGFLIDNSARGPVDYKNYYHCQNKAVTYLFGGSYISLRHTVGCQGYVYLYTFSLLLAYCWRFIPPFTSPLVLEQELMLEGLQADNHGAGGNTAAVGLLCEAERHGV